MPLDLSKLCADTLFGDGPCTIPNCPHARYHGAKFCQLCAAICFTSTAYNAHIKGSAHRRKAAAEASGVRETWLHCSVCNLQCFGSASWQDHVSGRRHARRCASCDVEPENVEPGIPPPEQYKQCTLCKEAVPKRAWSKHLADNAHKRRTELSLLASVFETSEQDRHNIVVSHEESGIDFGTISLERALQGITAHISITSAVPNLAPVSVINAEITKYAGYNATPFTVYPLIPTDHALKIPVTFIHDRRGRFEGRLELVCQGAGGREIVFTRAIRGVIGDTADRELLKPVTEYVRRRRAPWQRNRPMLSGDKPAALRVGTPWVKQLTRARIPNDLESMLKKRPDDEVIAHVRLVYTQKSESPTKGNHSMFFRALLWIEEARAVEDLRSYDIKGARLEKEGNLWTLHVEGLSEKRPSVVVGDSVHLQEAGGPAVERTYEGFVHTVRRDNIRISFHKAFNATGKSFNVCFQLNRVPLRRQHQALCVSTPAYNRILFPSANLAALQTAVADNDTPITLFNPLIGQNPAQLQAVKSILNIRPGTAPFVIFGPPGTGKTVTVVEAIRQILTRQRNARILACAPSNSAADLVAQRLTMLTRDEMFRCNAASRDPASLPEDLVPYTLYMGDYYGMPGKDKLMSYKLTISTCGNASFAYNVGLPQGHYTHIIVDEAGQASEPEVLTAIKAMADTKTIFVLAGDPKQLGPVIRSSIARTLGLETSYLERLLEMPLYRGGLGRGKSYIKLLKNYRSHGAILWYPNEKFYDNELEVCGPPAQINHFIGSSQLVAANFPIVFHAITGLNEREASSPSYFNIDEACQIKAYCEHILQDTRHPIRPEDIAVVTQYHAQVLKIRKLLRQAGMEGITVTSVENIQGQERMVIIMSTVRSSRDLIFYDAKYSLGFVSNPRRFNVAVTRAQALLIVVGDPAVLSLDPLWRGFMNYIYEKGGWRGTVPTWDVEAPILTEEDYAAEIREVAAEEVNAFMGRLEDDLEGGANFDVPFSEDD